MYCISSATEYIIMEISQNIPIYTYSATLAYYSISIIIYLKTPALECILRETWTWSIFISTSSTPFCIKFRNKSISCHGTFKGAHGEMQTYMLRFVSIICILSLCHNKLDGGLPAKSLKLSHVWTFNVRKLKLSQKNKILEIV